MNCKEASRYLGAYLDRELDLCRHRELEQHLSSCPECSCHVQELQELRSFFVAGAPYQAPPQLRVKVLAAIRQEEEKRRSAFFYWPWVYAAAVVVLSSFLAWNILFPGTQSGVLREAVQRYSESLSPVQAADIASANPQVVKTWLAAKLDFVPPVVGFPASGYSLAGARVDSIQNRPVATLVYKHGDDVVTLFCWPPRRNRLSKSNHTIDGYHVSTWSNAECNYILVSKLSDRQMDEFADSFRVHVKSGAYF